jgi:hypothetical protein
VWYSGTLVWYSSTLLWYSKYPPVGAGGPSANVQRNQQRRMHTVQPSSLPLQLTDQCHVAERQLGAKAAASLVAYCEALIEHDRLACEV